MSKINPFYLVAPVLVGGGLYLVSGPTATGISLLAFGGLATIREFIN